MDLGLKGKRALLLASSRGLGYASAHALADFLSDEEIASRCLMPEVSCLWDVSGAVALAVARQAIEDGVAERIDDGDLQQRIDDYRWIPEYPEMIQEGDRR